jgi:hypothetical protein
VPGTRAAGPTRMEEEQLELERRAGKGTRDDHPLDEATATDPSDYADERVAQPGDEPSDEDALQTREEP